MAVPGPNSWTMEAMRQRIALVVPVAAAFAMAPGLAAQSSAPDAQALQRMAATERAFAAATAEIGVRDGFLAFFAADAVQLTAGATGAETRVGPARPALEARPLPTLPLGARLMWEPFTGHVSSDGSLGWLTGAYVMLSNVEPREILGHGAYFSVWKRQADGTWRVWLDEGVGLPNVWQDASPFRGAPEPDPGSAGGPHESLEEAERAVAAGGAAWSARLAADARLHRDGVMPLVGRDAIVEWAAAAWPSVAYVVARQELAASGDLGVTMGGYDATARGGPDHGKWIRVWKRDVTGRWRVVFETSAKAT